MDRSATSHGKASSSDDPVAYGEQNVQENVHEASKVVLTEREEGISSYIAEKVVGIRRACDLRDLDALVLFAASEGGYLQDELRQLACKSISRVLPFDGERHGIDTVSQGQFSYNAIKGEESTSRLGTNYHAM